MVYETTLRDTRGQAIARPGPSFFACTRLESLRGWQMRRETARGVLMCVAVAAATWAIFFMVAFIT